MIGSKPHFVEKNIGLRIKIIRAFYRLKYSFACENGQYIIYHNIYCTLVYVCNKNCIMEFRARKLSFFETKLELEKTVFLEFISMIPKCVKVLHYTIMTWAAQVGPRRTIRKFRYILTEFSNAKEYVKRQNQTGNIFRESLSLVNRGQVSFMSANRAF